jgi:uncharacterized membrane protein
MTWNLAEWSDLVVRWFHVTAAISWIGSSLYLLWFDRIFPAPDRKSRGEVWLIDFSSQQLATKMGGESAQPLKAHRWLKREPALTWGSGVLLLGLLAVIPGKSPFLHADGSPLGILAGTAITVAVLALSWLWYDALYRSPVARNPLSARLVAFASLALLVWGLSLFLQGRTTFLLAGAALGTLMTFNVWWRMVPAFRELEAAREDNRTPDATICARASERGRHNGYLIFPTVALMLSGHYPAIYASRWGWLAACLIVFALIGVRHMVEGRRHGKLAFLSGLAAIGVAAYLGTVPPATTQPDSSDRVSFAAVRDIVHRRCLSCHSATPSDTTYGRSPGEVAFDTPESIRRHAQRIKVRSVDSHGMPIGQHADMPHAERELIGRWVNEGAEIR